MAGKLEEEMLSGGLPEKGAGGSGWGENKRLILSHKSDVNSNPSVILWGNPSFRRKNGPPLAGQNVVVGKLDFFFFSRDVTDVP